MAITIFTDGASRGNPGPGGWGVVIVIGSGADAKVTELGGADPATTNNRMELMAAIEALRRLKADHANSPASDGKITMFCDAEYVVKGITLWMPSWKRNGWRTKARSDVLNRDLWMALDDAATGLDIAWRTVGGHAGVPGNERCDIIATSFADGAPVRLYDGPLSGYHIKSFL